MAVHSKWLARYLPYEQLIRYFARILTSVCEVASPEAFSLSFCGRVCIICSTVGILIAVASDEAL